MSKENKTETLFQDDIEYSVKTPDRPYKYILDNKNVVYLNIAQLRFMRSEYWEEKQEQKYLSKCIIGFDKNGLKRCRKDCVKCEWYKSPRSNSGIVSLDDLDYELEEYQEDNEPIDFFKNPKIHSLLHIFINEITNEVDKAILIYKLNGFNETQIGKKLNICQRSIAERRKKIFKILKDKLNKYRY